MSLQSNNNKRIAKNTLLLYFRMLLYDGGVAVHEPSQIECVFGIYNVVGSVVAMFSVT